MPDVRLTPASEQFLADLAAATADTPGPARDVFLSDIREHISESITGGAAEENTLNSLGSPRELAASLRDSLPPGQGMNGVSWSDRTESLLIASVAALVGVVGTWLGSLLFVVLFVAGVTIFSLSSRPSRWLKIFVTATAPVSYALIVSLRVLRWVTARRGSYIWVYWAGVP